MSIAPNEPLIYIMDSFAILTYLEDEPGRSRVAQALEQALDGTVQLLLPLINLGEILYITERERGLFKAQAVLAALEQLPIQILKADRETVLSAAHIKAHYSISYADAFVVVAAQVYQATILTGDPEYQQVTDITKVEWLTRIE